MSTYDIIDLEIITSLQENPSLSHSEIAKRLGRSQPTISTRIKNLVENNHYSQQFGVDFHNQTEINMLKVDVRVTDTIGFMEHLQSCPLVLNAFKSTDDYNVFVMIAVRDLHHMDVFLDNLIRSFPGVQKMKTELISNTMNKFVMPVDQSILEIVDNRTLCEHCKKMYQIMSY